MDVSYEQGTSVHPYPKPCVLLRDFSSNSGNTTPCRMTGVTVHSHVRHNKIWKNCQSTEPKTPCELNSATVRGSQPCGGHVTKHWSFSIHRSSPSSYLPVHGLHSRPHLGVRKVYQRGAKGANNSKVLRESGLGAGPQPHKATHVQGHLAHKKQRPPRTVQ